MRFLIDARLPPALARWLTEQGHEAEHVFDCGLVNGHAVGAQGVAGGVVLGDTRLRSAVQRRYLARSASAQTQCSVRTKSACPARAGVAIVGSFIALVARISKVRPARMVKIWPSSPAM